MKHNCMLRSAWTVRDGLVVCVECGRNRREVFDERDNLQRAMRNLASSLRWAALGQAMFDAGWRTGYSAADASSTEPGWYPNVDGKAAPMGGGG